ncbi:MAG: DUF72 domain-containing protein [Moorellales bacterium]
MPRFYLGTSGYNYPHWREHFYPSDLPSRQWLAYYALEFNTVELNVTFYRLPLAKTFAAWRGCTPPGFVFAMKGSRAVTHLKRLSGAEEAAEKFFERASELGDKLGAVLWQLPPGLKGDVARLEAFLAFLRDHPVAGRIRQAFEFRHPSWFNPEIYRLLRGHGAGLCVADGPRWPLVKEVTADFVYVRFHGRRKLYASAYTEEELSAWAQDIAGWLARGLDVFAYFNNDAQGFALANARRLREMVKIR